MMTPERLREASAILDTYPATSPLIRLAELLSPASLIEPELLRQARLDCVRDATVDVEQALWFSELIRSRSDQGITLTMAVRAVLRDRLRQRVWTDRSLVQKAMAIMNALHGDLSPILAFEERLAWSEVFGNVPELRSAANTLLETLLSGREGVDHWLARAWDGLPQPLLETPAGRNLAQVAAQRGADIGLPETDDVDVGRVWHLLPLVPLYLRRDRKDLRIGVAAAEATHGIRVPDTRPIVVEVSWSPKGTDSENRRALRVRAGQTIDVGSGDVSVLSLAGARYELKATAGATPRDLEIEVLAAGRGQSLLLTYGGPGKSRNILIDCGPEAKYRHLRQRLASLTAERRRVELLVLTHVDADRIGGAIRLLNDRDLGITFDDIWFNGWPHLGERQL